MGRGSPLGESAALPPAGHPSASIAVPSWWIYQWFHTCGATIAVAFCGAWFSLVGGTSNAVDDFLALDPPRSDAALPLPLGGPDFMEENCDAQLLRDSDDNFLQEY